MSFAIAVRIAESSVRSSAGRAGHPAGGARKSATTSIASVAEPPLPSASSFPPASKRLAQRGGRGNQLVAPSVERLLAELADLGRLHHDRTPHVREDRLEIVLALGQERIEEARGARVVHRPASRPSSSPRCSKKTCTSSHSTW